MNFLTSFFQPGPETVLTSPHPPAECARLLSEAIDNPMVFLGKKPAIGSANPNYAELKRRLPYRNSFQSLLNITIRPEGAGARLSCRTAQPVLAQIFLLGFCAVGLIMLLGLGANVAAGRAHPALLIIPLLPLAIGFGIAAIGRGMSGGDEPFLLDFLRRTLDAR